jgi:hypothetical protein
MHINTLPSRSATIFEVPFQEGGGLNAGGINYQTLKGAQASGRTRKA